MSDIDIKANLEEILIDIEKTAKSCGRSTEEITLVGVTKYSETDDILTAWNSGLSNFGENRVQSALPKIEELPNEVIWHMIGHLQRNKVKSVIGKFALIHSVDSERLAEEINNKAHQLDIVQDILLEVNISGENSKFGLNNDNTPELVEKILEMPYVNLRGLMTMAPFVGDEGIIRDTFRGLRELKEKLETDFGIELPDLSMGMTNDYKIAIEEGATILRIGSAIFK